jgi:hypothetical protein
MLKRESGNEAEDLAEIRRINQASRNMRPVISRKLDEHK